RDDAGGDDVALEHLAIAAECGDALLDARAARVEQTDNRRARLERHVLHFDDLLRVGFRQRAPEHSEVLGEDIDRAAVDRAPAGDDAVAGDLRLLHAEVVRAVLDEHVELLERALVHQELDALARGQLAAFVLRVDTPLTAAEPRLGAPRFQPVENVLHRPLIPRLPMRRGIPRPTGAHADFTAFQAASCGHTAIMVRGWRGSPNPGAREP